MRINGKEVDMKKVVAQHEKENKLDYSKKKKVCLNSEWWNSEPGLIQKDKLRATMIEKGIHRQKIKYILTDTTTNETYELTGQDEVATFLGYKRFNSDLRYRVNSSVIGNKSRTKTFKIIIKGE